MPIHQNGRERDDKAPGPSNRILEVLGQIESWKTHSPSDQRATYQDARRGGGIRVQH